MTCFSNYAAGLAVCAASVVAASLLTGILVYVGSYVPTLMSTVQPYTFVLSNMCYTPF